jgi:hypothetical protein
MPWYQRGVDPKRARIDEIAASGRATRAKSSRALWIAGLTMGALCIAAFVAIMLVDGGSSSRAPIRLREGSRGFATGVAIGLAAGIAIGYAIARARRQSSTPHSERNSP